MKNSKKVIAKLMGAAALLIAFASTGMCLIGAFGEPKTPKSLIKK